MGSTDRYLKKENAQQHSMSHESHGLTAKDDDELVTERNYVILKEMSL